MGDISVIARRLADGHVQHGWSGNGGYFSMVGSRLLKWYTEPEEVEYLFSLGQLRFLGAPGSEKGGFKFMETHNRTGTPHYLGISEDDIFSKIAFVDYGYLYDIDNKWYYIAPVPMCMKIPLEHMVFNRDERGFEFDYLRKIEKEILTYILDSYMKEDVDLQFLMDEKGYDPKEILEEFKNVEYPLYEFFKGHRDIRDYFDDWVVVETNEDYTEVTGFKLKRKTKKHIETCEW